MELLTPALGLFAWTLVVFLVIVFLLKKLAWKPITSAIREREESIENALKSAEAAKKEMLALQSGIEAAKAEAVRERERIMKEANEIKNKIVEDARKSAAADAQRIVEEARESMNREKAAALNEIKSQVAALAIDMAEKVLEKKFENRADQEGLVNDYLKNIPLN